MNDPTTNKPDIQRRYHTLMRDDTQRRTTALKAVSEQTRPLFRALQEECAETGHKLKFDHFNWDHSYRWYKCEWCGAAVGENDVEGEINDAS